MTTGKNNILNNRCPPRRSGAPRGLRGGTEDVVFTSCSRCFLIDTQAIRSKILDLAMRGKLAEQLPEDGTAEDLYWKIQAEKQALIKAGKQKNEKPLPGVSVDDIQSEIPSNWKWVRLGIFGSWHAGATPSRGNSAFYHNGTIPWLKTGDLNDGYISFVPEYITDLAVQECSVQLNPVGSVLIAMYGATIGKLGIAQIPLTTNQACCACNPYSEIYNRFLFFLLMSMRKQFIGMGIGGAQSNISKDKIVNAVVPLPPHAEQHRIVEKIDQAFSILDTIDSLQAQYADNLTILKSKLIDAAIQGKLTEQLPEDGTAEELYQQIQLENQVLINAGPIKKAKPLAAITEDEIPFDIPANWKWVRLASVVDMLAGFAFKSADFKSAGKYRLLRGINLGVNSIRWNDTVYLAAIPERLSEYRIQSGDVLIGLDRPWISGGTRVAIFDDIQETYLVQRVLRLRESGGVVRSYIALLLRSSLLIKSLGDKTTGISVPHISPGQVGNLVVPLPPLAEQKRIGAQLEKLLMLCERLI